MAPIPVPVSRIWYFPSSSDTLIVSKHHAQRSYLSVHVDQATRPLNCYITSTPWRCRHQYLTRCQQSNSIGRRPLSVHFAPPCHVIPYNLRLNSNLLVQNTLLSRLLLHLDFDFGISHRRQWWKPHRHQHPTKQSAIMATPVRITPHLRIRIRIRIPQRLQSVCERAASARKAMTRVKIIPLHVDIIAAFIRAIQNERAASVMTGIPLAMERSNASGGKSIMLWMNCVNCFDIISTWQPIVFLTLIWYVFHS